MHKIIDCMMPRFVTEWVALADDGDQLIPVCCIGDLDPHEVPDAVCKVKSFNLFGYALFPRAISEPISFYEYLRLTK